MKTIITKRLEELLEQKMTPRNDFYVFECTIGWNGSEIVDCIVYNCQREITCYEIKRNKQDFYSKAKKTFIGNKNYYVMPKELYDQVKNDIPYEIGVYVSIKMPIVDKGKGFRYEESLENGFDNLVQVRSAKRLELKADKEVILSSMLRSMQRDRLYSREVVNEEVNQ